MNFARKIQRFIVNKTPPAMRGKVIDAFPFRHLWQWYNFRVTKCFILSFPKCGRTWLRVMLMKAIAGHYDLQIRNYIYMRQLSNQEPNVPRISVMHDDLPHRKRAEELESSKKRFRRASVIFLVRDPRDVIVSWYFHKSRRSQEYHGTLSDFIHEPVGSFDTVLRYYNIWDQNRELPERFLLVRYEELSTDPYGELRRILNFLNLQEISDEAVEEAIRFAGFDNMQQMEQNRKFRSGRLQPVSVADPESYKVRRGRVGGYVDYLSADEIAMLTNKMESKLSPLFGYMTETN